MTRDLPHPEERALARRLEGWPRVQMLHPSFETLASQAPQDEAWLRLAVLTMPHAAIAAISSEISTL